jgi:hypothetical protein
LASATHNPDPYWLLTWLGSKKITSTSELAVALGRPSIMRELRSVAERWSLNAMAPPPAVNLVAGAGLRLNDPLSCPSAVCRRHQVDILFRHAWHYFDTILLPDGVGSLLLSPPEGVENEYVQNEILGMVESALHIQNLGADRLVQYYPTIHGACGHAEASPLSQPPHWEAAWEAVETSILLEAEFRIKNLGEGAFSIWIHHPGVEFAPEFTIQPDANAPKTPDSLKALAVHRLVSQLMGALEDDLKVAYLLRGSLASTLWSHERAITRMSKSPDPYSVAFDVSFPTLENVPINELIAIRLANGDAFLAFRDSLTKAAKEMCACSDEPNYDRLANQIKLQVIDPEIARLNSRLRTAQTSLAKKATGTIALSTVGTLCAASMGLIPGAAAGAVLAASAIANLNKDLSKYIDDKAGIELSDMYFIWKALEHAE